MRTAFELTRGQPWLTNALARLLVEDLVPNRDETIERADVEVAKEILIRRRDTHLDSLIDRLREDRVRAVIEFVLFGGEPADTILGDDFQFVENLGLIAPGSGLLEIANPIYREIILHTLNWPRKRCMPRRRSSYIATTTPRTAPDPPTPPPPTSSSPPT